MDEIGPAGSNPEEDDPAVRWGKRVGRVLGLALAFFLVLNLVYRWF